jgi:hypothetical protein
MLNCGPRIGVHDALQISVSADALLNGGVIIGRLEMMSYPGIANNGIFFPQGSAIVAATYL